MESYIWNIKYPPNIVTLVGRPVAIPTGIGTGKEAEWGRLGHVGIRLWNMNNGPRRALHEAMLSYGASHDSKYVETNFV